ncbi:MAG: V-type ATP synthase subunit E [Clostridia bacterium]|nr:V-type ATP synthase subunit E [Clostridia bacterium]
MIGLEKVTGKITAEAEEDSAQLLAAAGEKCSQIEKAADEKIAGVKDSINSELVTECENIITRAKSTAAMQKRNIILSAKGKALENAFANAEHELINLPKEKYISFLMKYISAAVDFTPDASVCTVSMNKKDTDEIGSELIGLLSCAYPAVSFSLSDKIAPISGGAMLDFGETDVNCSVSALIAQNRAAMEAKVCAILFEDALS